MQGLPAGFDLLSLVSAVKHKLVWSMTARGYGFETPFFRKSGIAHSDDTGRVMSPHRFSTLVQTDKYPHHKWYLWHLRFVVPPPIEQQGDTLSCPVYWVGLRLPPKVNPKFFFRTRGLLVHDEPCLNPSRHDLD